MTTLKCERCGCEISPDESYTYLGQALCEDCYIEARQPAKACDPWAVYIATHARESSGLEGAEGLTDLQKKLYDFVKHKGKVTREELMGNFSLSESEVQTQLAILRHCELVKGHKEGDRIYLVPFS